MLTAPFPYAQRRPGYQPRLHPPGPRSAATSAKTLNEGQGINPGYTRRRLHPRATRPTLNEGQGINPGYTGHLGAPGLRLLLCAQRRPGYQPRLHRWPYSMAAPAITAQRRPGYQPRLHPSIHREAVPAVSPLNEGQGINPGYTWRTLLPTGTLFPAQRRPGYQPRLHEQQDIKEPAEEARSTKARVSTPATPEGGGQGLGSSAHAQRRPGYQPRLHPLSS